MDSIPGYLTIAAIATGLIFGVLMWLRVSRIIYQHYLNAVAEQPNKIKTIIRICGGVGTIIAVIPAFFFSIVIGGNFGGGMGEYIGNYIGIDNLGIPIGLGIGIFAVYFLIQLFGTSVGLVFGRALSWVITSYG